MMPFKFAASLMFMFKEIPEVIDKYSAAKAAGFNAVEGAFVNGKLGTAALPGQQEEFKEGLDISIKYAKGLKCSNIHILAAVIPSHDPADESKLLQDMEDVFVENLRYAADKLQQEGIVALIEPINPLTDVPGYFLTKQSQGIEIIKKVNHPNLKLMLDIYHAQIMDGYLTRLITEYLPLIGYIQISQVPDRGEPDSPGEINYPYIFKLLEEVKYDGYIGCEYKPTTEKTVDSLGWMKKYTE